MPKEIFVPGGSRGAGVSEPFGRVNIERGPIMDFPVREQSGKQKVRQKDIFDTALELPDELFDALEVFEKSGEGLEEVRSLFTRFVINLVFNLSDSDLQIVRRLHGRDMAIAKAPNHLKQILSDLLNCANIAKELGLEMPRI